MSGDGHHPLREGRGCGRSRDLHRVLPRHLAYGGHDRPRWWRDPGPVTAAGNILLTPARIGSVQIPNRIVMPPMTTRTADEDGAVTDDTMAYYLARARGGGGLITVQMAAPEKGGPPRRPETGLSADRFLPGLTRLVDAIHRAGSKASIQLGHGGGHTRFDICGETPIAPSA